MWDTNVSPWNIPGWLAEWPDSNYGKFLPKVFDAIKAGQFGPINFNNLHAVGFSSGAYMTSRMAFSYKGMFKSPSL